MMAGRVLNAGVVGLGVGAAGPLREMEISSLVHLTAGADPDPEVRAGFQKAYPEARTYEDVDALLRDPDIEAVWVQTPNRLHAEQAIKAANAGKHVVVQKPMALTLREAEAMVEASEKNGVELVAGNSHCYKTPFQMMGQIARSGELGKVRAINVVAYNGWWLQSRLPEDLDPANGGGIVYRAVPHQIDAIRLVGGGKLKSVRASVGEWMPTRPGPAYCTAYMEFSDGTPATVIQNSYGYFVVDDMMPWVSVEEQHKQFSQRQKTRRGLIDGTRSEGDYRERRVGGKRDSGRTDRTGEREWAADMGMVIVSCEHGDMRQSPSGVYVYTDQGLREVKVSGGTLWAKEAQELYDAVVNGQRGFHSGQSAIATIEVVLALMESAKTHCDIELTHQMMLADVVPVNHALVPDEVVELT
jgi:phthalate 4,5-cis-dihydrodiol dehydrogenase